MLCYLFDRLDRWVEQHRQELDARLNGKSFWCQFIAGLNVPSRAYPYHCEHLLARAIQHTDSNKNVGLSSVVLTLLRRYDIFFHRLSMCAFAMDRLNCSLPVYTPFTYEWDRRLTYFCCLYIWPPPHKHTTDICVRWYECRLRRFKLSTQPCDATVMQQTLAMKMRFSTVICLHCFGVFTPLH